MEKKTSIIRILLSLLLYFFFLFLGYVIAQYIIIPIQISYALFFLFGLLAPVIQIKSENLKKLRYVPLLRRHFGLMYRIHRILVQTLDEKTLKGALKFTLGIIFMIFYIGWMNFLINSFRYLLSFVITIETPFSRWMEAFFGLLGAGIVLFLLWFQKIVKKQKMIKKTLKSTSTNRRLRFIGSELSLGFTILSLASSYLVWIVGLGGFLLLSVNFRQFFTLFLYCSLFLFGFFMILLILILAIVSARSKKK